MNVAAKRMQPSERKDMQGLLLTAYGGLPEASFLLLSIRDRAAAAAWLAAAPITCGDIRDASKVLQLALTAAGMRALGVPEAIIAGFSAEFVAGMAEEDGRSRRLGDLEANAPARWRWGYRSVPHVLAALYAEKGGLAAWRQRIADDRFAAGFEIIDELPTSDMGPKEPFGFTDGISQPRLDWDHGPRDAAALAEYGNLIAAGEFVLGYRNEYGFYTDRPVLDAGLPGAAGLPAAEDAAAKRDLGRNGTYLVFRELHQDVRAFWRFFSSLPGDGRAVAEACIGRRIDGTPLVPTTGSIRGIAAKAVAVNGFTYEGDPSGLACPIGAHVRRANPRTGDMPGGRQTWLGRFIRTLGLGPADLQQDLVAASRFHRILRRGREFGSYLPREEAVKPEAPDPRAGLHFICLNANIARQFEFVQNAWLASAKFAGLSGESDPVIGNRLPDPAGEATDAFTMPQPNGIARRVAAIPQFVTVAGGAYFFLPGVSALRFLAACGSAG